MNSLRLKTLTSVAAFAMLAVTSAIAAPASATEKTRIDALISKIENLKDASFIRNGSSYSSANAAKFLRAKLSSNEDDVATAEEFISKLATKSSTSGQAYKIKFNDGHEMTCAEFLNAELSKASAKK